MKILSIIAKTILYSCGWVGLFLACRVGAWLAGVPAWWSLPAALVIGMGLLFLEKFLELISARKRRLEARGPESPRISVRLRRSWERGRPFRKGRPLSLSPHLPWYICMSMPGSLPGHLVEMGDAAEEDTGDYDDAFTWRRGPNAAWLDFPDSGPGDEEWHAFTDMLGSIPQFTPPAGVVIRIDSARLVSQTHSSVHDDAPAVRKRLDALQKACRKQLPFYIIVDNVDRLYGLRSIFSKANPSALSSPLGRIRHNCRDDSAAFVSAFIEDCVAGLQLPGSAPGPAALQAPDEIRRLEAPLIALMAQLGKNSGKGPCLRGLFLAATAPGGDAIPSLLASLPTFRHVDETLPVQPWFLRRLLREDIPADAEAARYEVGVPTRFAYPAGAAGLLACSLVVCLLMTFSFIESRGVLLSARGRAAAPKSPDTLQPYLELTTLTRLRNNGWRLPRFGMNEPEELEQVLRQRFTDSYFDLKTIPSIEHVQDAALEAAASNDPLEIGNALLLLAATRDGIGRNIGRPGDRDSHSRFLQTLVKSLRLATDDDMRQLETYFSWAGGQEWMPETYAALTDFERYIIDNAGGGDLSWLPAWIGRLPGLQGIDTSRVWDSPSNIIRFESRISPEWTMNGYLAARGFLESVRYGANGTESDAAAWRRKKEHALFLYRTSALEKWRAAASVLWADFQVRVPDSGIQDLFRAAASGDDPAARFHQLVSRELLPMFENVDDTANADLHWLRLHARLLPPAVTDSSALTDIGDFAGRLAEAVRDLGGDSGMDRLSRQLSAESSVTAGAIGREWRNALLQAGLAVENAEQNLEAVRTQYQSWSNPGHVNVSGHYAALQDAAETASRAHMYLRETTGSAAWDGVSPLATLDYMRYLATRQAALKLDSIWRDQIYQPAQLTQGDEKERLARLTAPGGMLEKFLTGTASGFWRWDGSKLVNTEWNRLGFMFDQGFLDFCSATLRGGKGKAKEEERMESPPPPLLIEAMHVDADARERPVAVRLIFESRDERQTITFRNYRLKEMLGWRVDQVIGVTMNIVFPSVTATATFKGAELDGFFRGLYSGSVEFERGLFPNVEAALGRMGVSSMVLRARLEGMKDEIRETETETPEIPRSTIVPSLAPQSAPAALPAHGPLTL